MGEKRDNLWKVSIILLLFQIFYTLFYTFMLLSGKLYRIFSSYPIYGIFPNITFIVFILIPLLQIWFLYKFIKNKELKRVFAPILSWLILFLYILWILVSFKFPFI